MFQIEIKIKIVLVECTILFGKGDVSLIPGRNHLRDPFVILAANPLHIGE